jgi:hypothetical protein
MHCLVTGQRFCIEWNMSQGLLIVVALCSPVRHVLANIVIIRLDREPHSDITFTTSISSLGGVGGRSVQTGPCLSNYETSVTVIYIVCVTAFGMLIAFQTTVKI